MVWLKNMENIAENKTSGKCPYCGSADTDYTLVGKVGSVGYGAIWCNNCKKAYHISRMLVQEGYNINNHIPSALQYSQS